MPSRPQELVLASTSPYRQALLQRLLIPFQTHSPRVDETQADGEAPVALAIRLARSKAAAGQQAFPQAAIIGSDQVAELEGTTLGKPGSEPAAIAQLQRCSGQVVTFTTAVCVLGPGGFAAQHQDLTRVHFRLLSDEEIRRYVRQEAPLDCAGSFKAEALGISLFRAIESRDPTGLTGLPLIWLAECLRQLGFSAP